MITARGITLSLRAWERLSPVSRTAIKNRIDAGWGAEAAIFTPDSRRAEYNKAEIWACKKCGPLPVEKFHKYRDKTSPQGWRYYGRCKNCRIEQSKDYGVADRHRRNVRLSEWRIANPDRARNIDRRRRHTRRSRLISSESPGVTAAEWREICERFDFRCAYCGEAGMTIDHVTPISRGGLDAPDNVVPACQSCNSSKGSRLLSEWLQRPLPKDGEPDLCHAAVLLEIANRVEELDKRKQHVAT